MSYLHKVEIERDQNRNREIRRKREEAEKKKKHDAWLATRTGEAHVVKYLGAYREKNEGA